MQVFSVPHWVRKIGRVGPKLAQVALSMLFLIASCWGVLFFVRWVGAVTTCKHNVMLCHKDFFIALPHPLHATRVAWRREPPAPRELDRQERTGPTWPNQSRLGSRVHERTAPYRQCYQRHRQSNFSMTLPSVSYHHSCTGCSQASCPGRQGQAWPDRVLFGSVSLNCIHFARLRILRKSLLDFPSCGSTSKRARKKISRPGPSGQERKLQVTIYIYIYIHTITYIHTYVHT